jgi:cathepsin B
MAERYRGTSPTHSKVKTTPEADEANKKAKAAFSKRNKKNTSIYSEYGYHIVIGGFIVLVLLAFANTFFSKSRNPDVTPVIEEDEIAAHNSRGFTFKLGPNDQFN